MSLRWMLLAVLLVLGPLALAFAQDGATTNEPASSANSADGDSTTSTDDGDDPADPNDDPNDDDEPQAGFRVVCSPELEALASSWTKALAETYGPPPDGSEGGRDAGTDPDFLMRCTAVDHTEALTLLLEGKADVVVLGRAATRAEVGAALEQHRRALVGATVALDGVVIVTHRSNRLTGGGDALVRNLFAGVTTGWESIGGGFDADVSVYGLESTTPLGDFFGRSIMRHTAITANTTLLADSAAVVAAMANDRAAIGFCSRAAIGQSRLTSWTIEIDIEGTAGEEVSATNATIRDGSYPYVRDIVAYTLGRPTDVAREFIAFTRTEAGHDLTHDAGYVAPRP